MVRTGHVLIGSDGELVSLDAGFCDIMQARAETMVGRPVVDVTAPADRDECVAAIEKLRRTGVPFIIVKRFVRADGTLVWVRNTVSIMADSADHEGCQGLIVATVELIEDEEPIRSPAMLLDTARAVIVGRKARATVCDPALFSEPAWDMVLEVYIAEAEGRAIDVETLAGQLDLSMSVAGRWVKALLQYGVIEVELRDPVPDAAKSYRLTSTTHRRLESYLARVGGFHTSPGIDIAA